MIRYYVFAALVAAAIASSIHAQVPRQISYQGLIANASGDPLTGSHDLAIKLYDADGSMLYTENFIGIMVDGGVFSVMLGTSAPLPAPLDFSKQYFLGVAVDGGAELAPRTPFASSPYALRAEAANALAPGANVVTSVNTISGAVKIIGGGATTVTRTNDTILVSSSGGGGGSGIQGVQNSDGTIAIVNPNGPVATINIGSVPVQNLGSGGAAENQFLKFNGALWVPSTLTDYLNVQTMPRLAGLGTSANKLDLAQQGATPGQVLKWNGISWAPGADNTNSFSLPYSATVSNNSTLFSITNSGAGRAGEFIASTTANTDVALWVSTVGSGSALGAQSTGNASAASFTTTTSPNPVVSMTAGAGATGGALSAINNGTGLTAAIRAANTSNSSNALEVSTTGTGKAAFFQITNNSNSNPALEANSSGTGHTIYSTAGAPNASALYGFHGGSGTGATGFSLEGLGVYGYSNNSAGVRGLHNAATGAAAGVEGKTNSAVAGTSAFGAAANGVYGEVSPTSPGAWSAGVRGYSKGTGANGVGVVGIQDGTGYGVYGESAGAGTGVYGKSTAAGFGGYFDVPVGGAGWGVVASTAAKPGGGVWAVFSDRNLKRDIRPFNDGLNIIERIDPVWYTYNGKGGMPEGETFTGIIAQDMQPLMPYAVKESRGLDPKSDERYLSFDGSTLTYIQINAIKELSAKLDAMQARIEALESALRERGVDPDVITK